MFVYVFVYLLLAFFVLWSLSSDKYDVRYDKIFMHLFFIIFLVMIGLRHEVGGDWYSYLLRFDQIKNWGLDLSLENIIAKDIGYDFINWLSAKAGLGIYGVNTFCALIFLIGLFTFLGTVKNKYLGLLIAYPYLIMVVSMGYTRQATALGFVLLAYTALLKEKPVHAFVYILFAFLFHKTSMICLLLFLNPNTIRKNYRLVFTILLCTIVIFFLLGLQTVISSFFTYYVLSPMSSEGGRPRAILVFIPAAFIVLFNRVLKNKFPQDYRFWLYVSLIAIMISVFSLLNLTFGDRLLLYFYPVQIIGFERMIEAFDDIVWKGFSLLYVVNGFGVVMLTWILFASHREDWLPYSNILLTMLGQ